MTLRAKIPAFYWYFCTVVDPLLSLSAVYLLYFNPSTFMDTGFAQSSQHGRITPSHLFLMHQFGGVFFFGLGVPHAHDATRDQRHESLDAFPDCLVLYRRCS
jgi:hypothetical protein